MKRDFDDFDREESFDSSYLDPERYVNESSYLDDFGFDDEQLYYDERREYSDEMDDSEYDMRRPDSIVDDDYSSDFYDDPIRIYLVQMGDIPMLTREQERSAANEIERTRRQFRKVFPSVVFSFIFHYNVFFVFIDMLGGDYSAH